MTAPALFTLSKVSVTAALVGCNPAQQARVTSISDYMIEGSFDDNAAGGNRVILGDQLARELGGKLNQTVLVTVGTNAPVPFKVVGRFQLGGHGGDRQAYAQLADVQKVNRTPNRVNEIAVKLHDYQQAAALATTWSSIAPELTESWDQQNPFIYSMFKIQDSLRFSMILTVLLVAGFGIYNVLNMTVNQKRQDIAILRSMGYDTFDVVMLFFLQGLIVGVIGTAFGLTAGYGICRFLQTIQFSSGTPANPQGYLHISLAPAIYLQAAGLALLASSLASVLPARAAGKLTPIEVIRAGG
jgi:lipoprotein-releasing system permease protein